MIRGDPIEITASAPQKTAALEQVRGLTRRGVPSKRGNAGKLVGYESTGGIRYARYQAEQGTWVSASLAEQGYDKKYGRDVGYGAYLGVARAPDGRPLNAPDRIKPGQQYLIPIGTSVSSAETPGATPHPADRVTAQRGLEAPHDANRSSRATDGRLGAAPRPIERSGAKPSAAPPLGSATTADWPFRVSAPPDVIKNYVDNRTRKLSINAVLGVVMLSLDSGGIISIPLAAFRTDVYNLVPILPVATSKLVALDKAERIAPTADLAQMGFTPCAFYRHESGAILPTVLNAQTLPNIWTTFREALILEGQRLSGWADAFEKLLQWYTVARIPIPPLKAGSAGFVARSVANELYQSTASASNAGQQMVRAASILSDMRGLTAVQKVDVILEFFKRIGFIAKTVNDEGTFILMTANDGKFAFKILKDTGQILYGRLNLETLEYVFEALR